MYVCTYVHTIRVRVLWWDPEWQPPSPSGLSYSTTSATGYTSYEGRAVLAADPLFASGAACRSSSSTWLTRWWARRTHLLLPWTPLPSWTSSVCKHPLLQLRLRGSRVERVSRCPVDLAPSLQCCRSCLTSGTSGTIAQSMTCRHTLTAFLGTVDLYINFCAITLYIYLIVYLFYRFNVY